MTGRELFEILISPAGFVIWEQLSVLSLTIAGLAFMVGWKRVAKRLIFLALGLIIIPFAVYSNQNEIADFLNGTPRWVLAPTLALAVAIILCWILWGLVALFFGPAIASSVTANILTWLIKGVILAVAAPYRGMSSLLRHFLPRDSAD
jgi:hypothetical protein